MKLNKGGGRTAGSRAVPAFRGRRLGTLCAGDAAPCWPRAWTPRGRGRDSGNLGVTRRPWKGLSSRRDSSPGPAGRQRGCRGGGERQGPEDRAPEPPHHRRHPATLLAAPRSQLPHAVDSTCSTRRSVKDNYGVNGSDVPPVPPCASSKRIPVSTSQLRVTSQ